MQITNLIQGSPEWHAHRAKFLNASDAPAMLGTSKYKTRDQLLHEVATGLTKPVDAGTQKLFDDGHKSEALARPIAEKIVGEDLYPVTATHEIYSASFDGITMDENIIFEHKSLNDELRESFANKDPNIIEMLPLMYRIQIEHQLMVSGAEKCLFMASKWNGETLVEEHHTWYYPDLKLRQRIIDGWALFQKDLAAYTPQEVKEKAIADVIEALPTPAIVAKGSLVQSNLNEITPQFDTYLAETPRSGFKTDLDFANAEANGKNARKMAKTLDDTCEAVISQQSDINQAITTMRKYAKEFNALGLALEKAVEAEKLAIKTKAILDAKTKYADHVNNLQAEIVGIDIRQKLALVAPDFAVAIKGVKTTESMQSRINDALNAGILSADALARDVRTKLAYLTEATKGYEGLFADKQTFIFTDLDHIKLMVDARINAQKNRDAEREAEIKAQAEARAKAAAEAERQAELLVKTKTINEVKPQVSESESLPNTQDQIAQSQSNLTLLPTSLEAEFGKQFQPSAQEIVQIIAKAKSVDEQLAHKWLLDTDFATMMQKAA